MAVWSEVKSNETFSTLNFAAEHYHPKKLEYLKLLNSFDGLRVGEIFTSVKDIFDPKKHILNEPARVYDLTDSLGNFLGEGNEANEETFKSAKKIVRHNDIIVSRLRSYLKEIAIVPNVDEQVLVSTEYIVLRPNDNALPEKYKYILPFLLSEPVQTILHWSQDGNEHPRFAESVLLNLKIPEVVINQKSIFREALEQAQNKIESSKILYQQAEALLLHELGLDALDLSNQIAYESSFDVFARNGRLDSEFYQPKYQILADALSSIGSESVGSWGKALKGKSVSEYIYEGVPVIRSGDLTDINNVEKFKYASPEEDLFYLKRGDVLISSIGFGSIGKVQVFEGEDNAFATVSEVTVIRQNRVNPYYLQLFLQSVGGQLQIEKWITGATGQLHLYPRDVEKFLIPIIAKEKQNRFEELIKNAISTKEQAKQLLEDAKRRVEEMILGA